MPEVLLSESVISTPCDKIAQERSGITLKARPNLMEKSSNPSLEDGGAQLNWIEVSRVWRQVTDLAAVLFDSLCYTSAGAL